MKTIIMIAAYLLLMGPVVAQQYFTKTGHISFYSSAPLEDITAENNQVTSIIDFGNGEMAFSLLMKGFHFEKALMEEHFNEKYVHSDQYPKSTFEGEITNLGDVDISNDGEYPVDIEGKLTIHGVTQDVTTTGTITVEGAKVSGIAAFPVTLADYDIEIPGVVKDNIAETVEITVSMDYQPYEK